MLTSSITNQNVDLDLVSEWHQYSLEQSCGALLETALADQDMVSSVKEKCLNAWSKDLSAEPLEILCHLVEPDELQLAAIVEQNSVMLANAYCANIVPAPFASQMATPNGFYEKHEAIYDMAKSFRCPLLFNEDADVIGLGSINPITATIFGEAIVAYISETLGIKPFVSKVRLSYHAWEQLCQKHFSR